MTPDAIFDDPRLARLYDAATPIEDDQLGLVEFVGDEPLRVLDLGCGTGRIACMLADRGHDVVRVEPARAMLDLARDRDPTGLVRWIEGDARDVELGDDHLAAMPRPLRAFSRESLSQGLSDWPRERVTGPASFRLYQATATAWFILADGPDERLPVRLP